MASYMPQRNIMIKGTRKLELVCVLCNQPLAALQLRLLSEETGGAVEAKRSNSSSITECVPPGIGHGGKSEPSALPAKDEVVATKCGHMFHHGCLRTHVHQSHDGRGGNNLFCPICTKPFAMNRVVPVIIPATAAQREKYEQYRLMKSQNAEMHHQLQELRSKIAESEKELKKIKEDSEECLNDIQAKQKLLNSVCGPTSKEMAELTKLHIKRQEILHVVTQHNADLLKLLAEESNMGNVRMEHRKSGSTTAREPDMNQNFLPQPQVQIQPSVKLNVVNPSSNTPTDPPPMMNDGAGANKQKSRQEVSEPMRTYRHRSSRKLKKNKSGKRSRRRKNRSKSQNSNKSIKPYIQYESSMVGNVSPRHPPPKGGCNPLTADSHTIVEIMTKQGCRKVDTVMKWEVESLLDQDKSSEGLSDVDPFSRHGAQQSGVKGGHDTYRKDYHPNHAQRGSKDSGRVESQYPPDEPLQPPVARDSISILLARKPPMKKEKKRIEGN